MKLLRTILVSTVAVGAAVALSTPVDAAPAATGTPSALDTAVGTFTVRLTGTSTFVQTSPTTITVTGKYSGLPPNRDWFTVIYANTNCDPAQAFPVGPFHSGPSGNASISKTVTSSVPVSGTMSMSVRYADDLAGGTPTDRDHDGIYGKNDVVAVAGQPLIGLRECNGFGSNYRYDNRAPVVT